MLHHDGHIAYDHAGKRSVRSDGLRIVEIVEAQMTAASRRNFEAIRSDRIFRLIIQSDFDVRGMIASIQNAYGFMAGHLRCRSVAVGRDVTFRNCPISFSDIHTDVGKTHGEKGPGNAGPFFISIGGQ